MNQLICGQCFQKTKPVLKTSEETEDRFSDERESVYVSDCCQHDVLYSLKPVTFKEIQEALS